MDNNNNNQITLTVVNKEDAQAQMEEGAFGVTFRIVGGQEVPVLISPSNLESVNLIDFLNSALAGGLLDQRDVVARVNGSVTRSPETQIHPGDEVVTARQRTNG